MLKFLLFFVISINIFSYTSVSPLYFDERIDEKGGYKEYTLSNATNRVLGYKIYFEPKTTNKDMSKWVDYYPKALTLNPGESKKVKVLITSPKNTKSGEYLSNMCIKEVETPKERVKNIRLLTNLKIELAGYVGNIKTKVEVSKAALIGSKLNLVLKNVGEKREKLEIYLKGKKEKYYIDSARLFINGSKNISKDISEILKKERNLELYIYNRKGELVFKKRIT